MSNRSGGGSLSEPYRKVRRQLGLFSGLLLFWEFVDLDVGQLSLPQDARLHVGRPDGIPVVLVFLILFMCMRLAIEWRQSAPRRKRAVSRVDMQLSYAVAFAALAVYSVQQLTPYRLADYLSPTVVGSGITGGAQVIITLPIIAFVLGLALRAARGQDYEIESALLVVLSGSLTVLLGLVTAALVWGLTSPHSFAFMLFVTASTVVAGNVAVVRLNARSGQKESSAAVSTQQRSADT